MESPTERNITNIQADVPQAILQLHKPNTSKSAEFCDVSHGQTTNGRLHKHHQHHSKYQKSFEIALRLLNLA